MTGASALSASSCNTYLKGGGGVTESGISSLLFKGAFPFLPLFSFLYQELFYTKAIKKNNKQNKTKKTGRLKKLSKARALQNEN